MAVLRAHDWPGNVRELKNIVERLVIMTRGSVIEPKDIPHIIGDATSDDTLMRAGIRAAKGLVACSDSDVVNVYVTLSARALNQGSAS
jgi:DNA-binding NtrC family response regulator